LWGHGDSFSGETFETSWKERGLVGAAWESEGTAEQNNVVSNDHKIATAAARAIDVP
jgi:hypothetical protein